MNISNIHNCYGCGVCAATCAKKLISIELNSDGFYEPSIKEPDKCSDCGLCLEVCAFSHSELANNNAVPIMSWAAWSNNEDVRHKCSSGGVGYEIGKQLIEKGYHAVGCRYDNKKQRAEHFIATAVEDYTASIGSKYIQSYTADAFSQIKKKRQKYLITGTPCQIDSFRRLIRKFHCEDNFILMDFFCHCVPSMFAWRAYMKMLEPKIGNIIHASWRNKFDYGKQGSWQMGMEEGKIPKPIDWHDSWNFFIIGDGACIQSRMSQGDLFYKLFLDDIAFGPQCQTKCKYKYDHSSADIRIGDLWGKTYQKDQKGVSGLVAFTEKGLSIIESLKDVTLIVHPFEIVAEGQMKENAKPAPEYSWVMHLLRMDIKASSKVWMNLIKVGGIKYRLIRKIKKILKL